MLPLFGAGLCCSLACGGGFCFVDSGLCFGFELLAVGCGSFEEVVTLRSVFLVNVIGCAVFVVPFNLQGTL